MQGIELSRNFFRDIVQPWLGSAAPNLQYAAALGGSGSELLGFDDETSRDHNWGPRVHIYLDQKSFDETARTLVDAFGKAAPNEYLGEPIGWRCRPQPAASGPGSAGSFDHGLEIHTLEAIFESSFAVRSVDKLQPRQWLGFAEQKLLAFVSSVVFRDDDGRLTLAREALGYFPDDIWLYKIACQWRRIAEEQAFVGRAGQVGDDLGSRIIAARLTRDVMRMSFLLERRYAPYSKWLGTGFAKLPIASSISPLLQEALLSATWQERGEALAAAYLVLARKQNEIGAGHFNPAIGPYHDRPFATINADDAGLAAQSGIRDAFVKSLPVVGSVDQVSDLTPLLEDADLSQRMMGQLNPVRRQH